MEVDDAVTTASSISTGVKLRAGAGTEETESNGGAPSKNSIDIQKKPVDNGDSAEVSDKLTASPKTKSGSVQPDTPIKLRLTSDEDLSDLETWQSVNALKRKRFQLRRSGSKECLLGFDEESFEAELVKDEAMMEMLDAPAESPRQKRFKRSPPSAKSSPKTPPTSNSKASKGSDQQKNSTEKSLPPHVVGDNEDGIEQASKKISSPKLETLPNQKSAKPVSDLYKKPFDYGWKRELVWRSNLETKADVYFIAPNGKKLRSRSDIIPYLEGELTIDHFSFAREPLNVGPELEIVRVSKPSGRGLSTTAPAAVAASPPLSIGKRVSKPKAPKGASPPPEGWTPTRALKVNNAHLQSSSNSSRHINTPSNTNTSTPHSGRHHSSGSSSKHSSSSRSKKNAGSAANVDSLKTQQEIKVQKSQNASLLPAQQQPNIPAVGTAQKPCTYDCPLANGKLPQLQCRKCLCLFHHECVGLNPGSTEGRDYVCEACNPPPATVNSPARVSSQKKLNSSSRGSKAESKLPQTITVVKGKKYVMVTKQNAVPSASQQANDIENDLRQIKEGIQHTHRKGTSNSNAAANNLGEVEHPNKQFVASIFANFSYAYDAMVCVLKYLKIHERSRAAAVCRLWHLAAKDTSLWQTVRMKNSKVCNWAGFAAALRRGETKHLDLRKMLLPSGRSDDMWQGFSEHIGTVCSIDCIDLCRCPASVVESLFASNRRLRILNAVAINDDALNLENLALMTELEELRLRTCGTSVIVGDLQPLRTLSRLTYLSLTGVRGLGAKNVEVLAELRNLSCLELGECGDFDVTFANSVLPHLTNLQRLRLENASETACCTVSILEAVAQLPLLAQLELVNFDIKPGFDDRLCQCVNIRKLLIIPTYISQSATTNHIVLNAVQQIANTLKVFTWGVTVELLRVTALYVDQCDDSTKKKKQHFDECIPVLKPVPGAPPADEDESIKQVGSPQAPSDVPQIEILPLEKVETILGENLPNTKFTIVKVPYIATGKQQLVE